MAEIARQEGVDEQIFRESFNEGRAAIFKASPSGAAVALGEDLRVKVNANIGTSPISTMKIWNYASWKLPSKAGVDTVMDLSTGGDLRSVRRKIVRQASVPVGSVPIYEAIVEAMRKSGGAETMQPDEITIPRLHGEDGIVS